MSIKPDTLEKDEHARILREHVIPESGMADATSQQHPKAVILAGQPGAGKGSLASAAGRELNGDVVSIDPDDLRRYHPEVRHFRRESPLEWSTRTHVDASAWADELLDAASSAKKNLIFDTTLSNGKWAAEVLIKGLQEKGYDVEVRVVAAHKLESELGVDRRFTDQLDRQGYGRYVPKAVRDAIYDKIPESLGIIQASTDVDIRIYTRDGDELYYDKRDAELGKDVLIQARNERLKEPEVTRELREEATEQVRWHRALPEHVTDIPDIDGPGERQLLKVHGAANILEESLVRAERNATLDELVRPGAPPARAPVSEPGIPGLRRAGLAAGATGLGIAASAYDAYETGQRVSTLLQQQNAAAAQSEFNHFAARGIGGWTGGALAAGAVGTSGAGPLLLVAADAYLFAKAFEKAATLKENHSVYHQRDKAGLEWEFDGRNWVREVSLDRTQDGVDNPVKQEVSANYEKARELGAYASRAAVGLALGKAPTPQDPFNIPARPGDRHGLDNQNWHRDAHTEQWVRQVKTGVTGGNDRGTYINELATPARAAELNREARDRIEDNIANGREAVAAAYLETHAALRSQDFVERIPAAVEDAKAAPDVVLGSDNQRYHRNEAGEWTHDGDVAQGNLALELELTRQLRQPWLERSNETLAELQASPAPTPAQVERNELLHRYQTYSVRLPEDWLPAIELANQRTREAHGITGRTLQELQPGEMGLFSADSTIVHYQAGADGVAHKVAITSTEEIRQAYGDLSAQRLDQPPLPDAPELRISTLSPREQEAHQQALREANREGASAEEAAQAASVAALQAGGHQVNAAFVPHPEREARSQPAASIDAATSAPQLSVVGLAATHAVAASDQREQVASHDQGAHRLVSPAAPDSTEQQRLQQEEVRAAEREGDTWRDVPASGQDPVTHTPEPSSRGLTGGHVPPVLPAAQIPMEQPQPEPMNAASMQDGLAQRGQSSEMHPLAGDAPTVAAQGFRATGAAQEHQKHASANQANDLGASASEFAVARSTVEATAGSHEAQPLSPERPEVQPPSVQEHPAAERPEPPQPPDLPPPLIDTKPAVHLTPLQPEHPDHVLYQQIREQVTALDAAHGRTFDQNSERLTGSLLVLAKNNGLDRVDHVVLSSATADQPAAHAVFVVQGELDNPAHLRASMPTQQAVKTPFEESLQQFDVVAEEQEARVQQLANEQQFEDQRVQQEMQVAAASMGY